MNMTMVCATRAGGAICLAQESRVFQSSRVQQLLQLTREAEGRCTFLGAPLTYEGSFEVSPVIIISHPSRIYRAENILREYTFEERLRLGFCAEKDPHRQIHNRLRCWGFRWNPCWEGQMKDPEFERELAASSPLPRDSEIVRQLGRQMDLLQEELM